MNGTYNIFVIDKYKNHIYIDNIPINENPESFLLDHNIEWLYWTYNDRDPISFYYTYKDAQLLKSDG